MQFSGAVLAGGKSRRFGQDKACFVFWGKPLLRWVLDGLGEAEERFVVAGRDYAGFGVPTYSDLVRGGDVLSGLHAALHYAKHEWVAVAGCDQPFLRREYWSFLRSLTGTADAVVAVSAEGFFEPLGALYRKGLETELQRRLHNNQLKLQSLLAEVKTVAVAKAELIARFGPELFLNANRPEDLAGFENQSV